MRRARHLAMLAPPKSRVSLLTTATREDATRANLGRILVMFVAMTSSKMTRANLHVNRARRRRHQASAVAMGTAPAAMARVPSVQPEHFPRMEYVLRAQLELIKVLRANHLAMLARRPAITAQSAPRRNCRATRVFTRSKRARILVMLVTLAISAAGPD